MWFIILVLKEFSFCQQSLVKIGWVPCWAVHRAGSHLASQVVLFESTKIKTPRVPYLQLNQILNNMWPFSVSSKYISNLIAGLNLTLVTAISAFAPNRALAFASNTTTLPSSSTEYYNISRAISAFSVIVKPAFIKYLKETRKKSIKYIP